MPEKSFKTWPKWDFLPGVIWRVERIVIIYVQFESLQNNMIRCLCLSKYVGNYKKHGHRKDTEAWTSGQWEGKKRKRMGKHKGGSNNGI